jgi:thiamine monophosphate synthase
MPEPVRLPKLYAILDVACFAPPLRTTAAIVDYARELAAGGVTCLQYRNKA